VANDQQITISNNAILFKYATNTTTFASGATIEYGVTDLTNWLGVNTTVGNIDIHAQGTVNLTSDNDEFIVNADLSVWGQIFCSTNAYISDRLFIVELDEDYDTNYHAPLVITKPASNGQYINLVRWSNFVWSIGYVYNTDRFAIGIGNTTDSDFDADVAALIIETDKDIWVAADMSAASFTDRTPYPQDLTESYVALESIHGEYGHIDYKRLNPILKSIKSCAGYTFVEWIGENFGAESPRGITPLAVS
jgi:hypothetical protein